MRRTQHALAAFGVALATLAYALASHALDRPVPLSNASPSQYFAIDGDTLQHRRSGVRYRVSNIDTPETGRFARCAAERQLGERATRRVRELLNGARSMSIRGERQVDDYGRIVARVFVDGRDLGALLVDEGFARPWRGAREPWCDDAGRLLV